MKEPRRKRVKVPPAENPMTCPFIIVIDSREQAPFTFSGIEGEGRDAGRPLIVETRIDALESGDYSIVGLETRLSIERKSVSDFFGSIGSGRTRFEAEMERLAQMDFAAVVIEGDWRELLIDRPNNVQVPGKVASRTIVSWAIRYGVHFVPTMGRRHAELLTFQYLSMFWRQEERRLEREEQERVHRELVEAAVAALGV